MSYLLETLNTESNASTTGVDGEASAVDLLVAEANYAVSEAANFHHECSADFNNIAEGDRVAAHMENLANVARYSVESNMGGLDRCGAALLDLDLRYLSKDQIRAVPNFESFGSAGRRVDSTTLTYEAVAQTIKDIYARIKKEVLKLVEKMRVWFNGAFGAAAKLVKAAEAMKKKIEGLSAKSPDENKIDYSMGKKLHIDGKMEKLDDGAEALTDLVSSVTGDFAKNVQLIAKNFGGKLGDVKVDNVANWVAWVGEVKTASPVLEKAQLGALVAGAEKSAVPAGDTRFNLESNESLSFSKPQLGDWKVYVVNPVASTDNGTQEELQLNGGGSQFYNTEADKPAGGAATGAAGAETLKNHVRMIKRQKITVTTSKQKKKEIDEVSGDTLSTAQMEKICDQIIDGAKLIEKFKDASIKGNSDVKKMLDNGDKLINKAKNAEVTGIDSALSAVTSMPAYYNGILNGVTSGVIGRAMSTYGSLLGACKASIAVYK